MQENVQASPTNLLLEVAHVQHIHFRAGYSRVMILTTVPVL